MTAAEPLDPTLAEIRERVEDSWAADSYILADHDRSVLLAAVDRLAEALAAERARVQHVEAVRDDYQSRAELPDLGRPETPWPQDREMARLALRTVVERLNTALAGDTEGAGQ